MDRPDDMWAWAHERPVVEPARVDASHVLAVVVAHNGEQWLPRTLIAIGQLDVRPGRLVAVDAGSSDGSRQILDKALDEGLLDDVISGDGSASYGAAVQAAVENSSDSGFHADLIWMLHDDSAPDRTALSELLRGAADDSDGGRPAIVVPALLHPKRRNHPDQMSAVGESIAPSGQRVLTVEPGEIDQKQQEPARVLGASTAGMLVTMDAWRELGGFEPAVPLFRDGVDLGWRANARGMIVRTHPRATLRHVEAGRIGLRDSRLAPESAQADLAAGMTVVTMHSAKPGRTIARLSAQSMVNAFGLLLGKSPRQAAAHLRAAGQVRRNREPLTELAARYTAVEGAGVPAGLLPERGWGVGRFFEQIARRVSDSYYDLLEDDTDEEVGLLDELTGDDFAGGRRRVRFFSPAIVGMVVMLVLTLLASRELIGLGLLRGPALLPAPGTLGQAWDAWARSDPGMVGSNAPWLGWMALGSTLAFGQPDWFASLLLLGGPALAGWSAFHFLRPIAGPGWWTPVLACLWGTLLPVVGATGQGSIDVTVLAISLPVLGIFVRRWLKGPTTGAEAWRAPAAVGLVMTVIASLIPLMWVVGLAVAIWVAVLRRHLIGGLVAGLAPLVLLSPWLPRLLADPGRLLVGADPASRDAGSAPSFMRILFGGGFHPMTPIFIGLVAIGLLWVVGIVGAVRGGELIRGSRWALLALVFAGPVAGAGLSRTVVEVAGAWVRPDYTAWTVLGLFGLLALASYGIDRPPVRQVDDSADDLAQHAAVSRRRSLLGVLSAVALLAAAGWWVADGTGGLSRDGAVLPTYVTGVQDSTRATRTLMIDLSGGVADFNMTSATNPAWGDAETPALAPNGPAASLVRQVAQQFAAGQPSDDLAQRLAELGVGHVWLRGSPAEAISRLSAAPRLEAAPADDDTVVFTVTSLPSRAMISQEGEERPIVDAHVPATADGALIVLSEIADPQWRATIDGEQLTAESDGWRQTWSIEHRTGTLETWLQPDWPAVVWQVVMLLVLLVLAAPTAQRAQAPRRALATQGAGGKGGRR